MHLFLNSYFNNLHRNSNYFFIFYLPVIFFVEISINHINGNRPKIWICLLTFLNKSIDVVTDDFGFIYVFHCCLLLGMENVDQILQINSYRINNPGEILSIFFSSKEMESRNQGSRCSRNSIAFASWENGWSEGNFFLI